MLQASLDFIYNTSMRVYDEWISFIIAAIIALLTGFSYALKVLQNIFLQKIYLIITLLHQ